MLSPLKTNRKSRWRRGWIRDTRAWGAVSAGAVSAGAVRGVSVSGMATVSGFTLSLHADDDAVAVFVLDVQDGSHRLSGDGCPDPIALLVRQSWNHAQGGVGKRQRDPKVHDLASTLADANPQLARVVDRWGWRRRRWRAPHRLALPLARANTFVRRTAERVDQRRGVLWGEATVRDQAQDDGELVTHRSSLPRGGAR